MDDKPRRSTTGKKKAICFLIIFNILYLAFPISLITVGIVDLGNSYLSVWTFITATVMIVYLVFYWKKYIEEAKLEKERNIDDEIDKVKKTSQESTWKYSKVLQALELVFLLLICFPGWDIFKERILKKTPVERFRFYPAIMVFCIIFLMYYILRGVNVTYLKWRNLIQDVNDWAFKSVKVFV